MTKKYLLDPFQLPIYGQKMIEGSAGTGKTYILIILYVRLLLGLTSYKEESQQCSFTVKDILVLTFSEQLTQRLKIKIKEIISNLKIACVTNISDNIIINELLLRIKDRFKAYIILDTAEKQLNEASIFNIKTFCRRILLRYADKSYENIEYKLLNEENFFLNRIIKQFWKEHVDGIKNLELYKLIVSYWGTDQVFIKYIVPLLKNNNLKLEIIENKKKIEEVFNKNIRLIFNIKSIFQQLSLENLNDIIYKCNLNKNFYSSHNIANIYKIITKWINNPKNISYIPSEIRYLSLDYLMKYSNKVIKKDYIGYNLFYSISFLLKNYVDIKKYFIYKSLLEIPLLLQIEKDKKVQLTYDDLLIKAEKLVLHSKKLPYTFKNITDQYPIVLIDEFQDLNRHQVNIFYKLYILPKIKNIVLLGDPKQSIYNFMGSDLYLYNVVKRCIKDIYYLPINWRSSSKLINNINWLFNHINYDIIFRFFRFEKIQKNKNYKSFTINGVEQKAFIFWYYNNTYNKKGITYNIYRKIMAKQCAYQIKDWLLLISKNKAQIILNNQIRKLTIRDIVIIVRNKIEADLMKRELAALQIQSIYLSDKENIFFTIEAYELINLLHFIYYYKNTQTHKYIDNNNILYISSLNQKDASKCNQSLLELTGYYKNIWIKYGILCMLKTFLEEEKIGINLLSHPNPKSILDNILHLGEIIQNKYFYNPEPVYILRWLENKINNNNYSEQSYTKRIINNNVITILSIHKSKGLQFPIVCLPFICYSHKIKSNVYYNSITQNSELSLEDNKKINYISNTDILEEDLRLLYVSLNRAILHCCIGISPITKYGKKDTDLHKNALGYLLQKTQIFSVVDTNILLEKISLEQKRNISVVWLINNLLYYNLNNSLINNDVISKIKIYKDTKKNIKKTNTYSSRTHNINSVTSLITYYKSKNCKNIDYNNNKNYKIPIGIKLGNLLHNLLEKINFEVPLQKRWLKEELISLGYNDNLLFIYLYKWLNKILIYPFNKNKISLSKISREAQMRELNFVISIRHNFKIKDLNDLFYKYLKKNIALPENTVLKDNFNGKIDLLFFFEGKYYILDYKSHYLGDKKDMYKTNSLKDIIYKKYYWIQYHLYTLAVHRYLMIRDHKYDYTKDFGGVYYYFVRAVNYLNRRYTFDKKSLINNYGIVYTYPDYKLIYELNSIFK